MFSDAEIGDENAENKNKKFAQIFGNKENAHPNIH